MAADIDQNTRLAADAAVTAGLLDTGRMIFRVSGATLLMTLVVWLMGHPVHTVVLAAATLLAIVQLYFAQRVRFDADIFRLWASRWHHGANPATDLAAFDARVGRRTRPATSIDADLADRRRGARRLLRWQALCGAVQLALSALALWT